VLVALVVAALSILAVNAIAKKGQDVLDDAALVLVAAILLIGLIVTR